MELNLRPRQSSKTAMSLPTLSRLYADVLKGMILQPRVPVALISEMFVSLVEVED